MSLLIRDMFASDINRHINGVIKVNADQADVISQEVREYVITKDLKKLFTSFFNVYTDAFTEPTNDIGVWISGFFGSGKSHFLKMLSYLLENKEIDGKGVVEHFREKFADDPATFMLVDKATQCETETILFNIGVEAGNKDDAPVLSVFAKKFYSHLGFYGENLKVTRFEQHIAQEGKTEEFRRVFEQKKGIPWLEQRRAFGFNGKYIVPTLMEVLDMSEADAQNLFRDKTEENLSPASFVQDIKEYVRSKPKNFRLLFMVDEVGQYTGSDIDRLLNLQSLVEEIGKVCGGSVWVVCTGQEAVDEIIRVRTNEFSRIQARFKTRLSLSPSSVDEVIQKRLLSKKPDVIPGLEALYGENDSVLRNLFSFRDCRQDIKGFGGPQEFADVYPFVPYQFKTMQNVFKEIRTHGNVGMSFSDAERSMLSAFQDVAKKVQDRDEYALVPFFCFYDHVHSFLDSSIRRVIERCQNAAESGAGIQELDVQVLKLLYLIRYVDDIKSTLDNIVILMADDIRRDKVGLREEVRGSLDRLVQQNYVNRTADTYMFLTDEEQDIQREIKNTLVDSASIAESIGKLIFNDIYRSKKFSYGKNVFPFELMVDDVVQASVPGSMKLQFITLAGGACDNDNAWFVMNSRKQALLVLQDSGYYDALEKSMKIEKYVRQRNVRELPESMQKIIKDRQDEAADLRLAAREALCKAIRKADCYVDGVHLPGKKSGSETDRIEQALEYLVAHVYSELDQIKEHADSDADILDVLAGKGHKDLGGMWPNQEAAATVEEYLQMQAKRMQPTSMADIQSRYQAVPYGWRETDIALVVAMLLYEQKITVKQSGSAVLPGDRRLPGILHKKNEIGKTGVSLRQNVSAARLNAARGFLRDYLDCMDVPGDEDGLVSFIVDRLTAQKEQYEELLRNKYAGSSRYPGRADVQRAVSLLQEVLSQRKDNDALVSALAGHEDELFESRDALQRVTSFFDSQKHIFDAAVKMLEDLKKDQDYLDPDSEVSKALEEIRQTVAGQGAFDYGRIPKLNSQMDTVRKGHGVLLDNKRRELLELAGQCMDAVRQAVPESAAGNEEAEGIVGEAQKFFSDREKAIGQEESLALLDSQMLALTRGKDKFCDLIEKACWPILPAPKPDPEPEPGQEEHNGGRGTGGSGTGSDTQPEKTGTGPQKPDTDPKPEPQRKVSRYSRQVIFSAKCLNSEADIDAYVERIRSNLKKYMKDCDSIELY